MEPPPPPPPPHGANAQGGRSGGLPDGKYDIFVVPPSSAGAGFLYLPSLQTQRNSFLAGVACTATIFFIYSIAVPAIKDWFYNTMYGGGSGVVFIILAVGVISWAFGKTQGEGAHTAGNGGGGSGAGASANGFTMPGAGGQSTPKSSWQRPPPQANSKAGATNAKTSWEKAREETRKKEEERRKTEELKKKREDLEKERQRQREKDAHERLERERKEKKAREERDTTGKKRPPMPTARTEEEDDAYSFRPYDRPKHKANSAASMYSESSYAASQSTAKTTPPPTHRGPYTTKDPDKIIIKGVYSFNNAFQKTPVAQLISGKGSVTDGLILRITTEGLFIDDDVRCVPQREWDIKAWTMKLAESCELGGLHILRASIRDQEGKKYVFVLAQSEGWKVALGLQRLRRGTQVRALGVAGLPLNEAKGLVENLGWT